MAETEIYHCSSANINGGGGIETYVASLLGHQANRVKKSHISLDRHRITSLKNLDQSQFSLLHIHDPDMLVDLEEECPAVFTLHNHSSYCPSGTKHLPKRQKHCDRTMHPLGCGWGHIVDGCGSRRPQNIWQNWWNAALPLAALKKLQIPIIANSDYVRGQMINSGILPQRVVTLHCGVQQPQHPTTHLTQKTHQNQRMLFVGRIVPDKGIEWLIQALAKTNQQIHLDVAGDGWARPAMERLAFQMGLGDRISWHGWCQTERLAALYQECLAVVFPSLWPEPAGLVTLEAYSHYRPVIASASGGIPEYVQDGKTGILISPYDISQLADAMTELSTNYLKSRSMGELGQAWFQEKFTLDLHIQRLQDIYAKTIAEFKITHA